MADNLAKLLMCGTSSLDLANKLSGSDDKDAKLALGVVSKAYNIKIASPGTYKKEASGAASLAAKSLSFILKKYGVDTTQLDGMISSYDDFLTVYSYGSAFTGSTVLSASTCVAAWGGANVAHILVKGIRALDPNLGTDAQTEATENAVFKKLGGGAAAGAAGGALIGAVGGPVGAAIGAALGGAGGSVAGAVSFAVEGSPPPPGGCYFHVEAGKVDVKVKVWGPGAGFFGADYYLHTEFKISPGTFHHENSHPRNIQLIVNGKCYEIKDVLKNYTFVSIDNAGFVRGTATNGGRQSFLA